MAATAESRDVRGEGPLRPTNLFRLNQNIRPTGHR
jgi:hypothetical protein